MKFEKLNENKLRIIVTSKDLIEKNIDFHSFMSNSLEMQDIFLDILEKAEKEVGFITKNHKVRIEAFAINNEDFIFTVTKLAEKNEKEINNHIKLKFKRKKTVNSSFQSVYKFNTLDDFLSFALAIQNSNIKNLVIFCKSTVLYTYKDNYYLVFTDINNKYKYSNKIFSLITEFGVYVNNSELFASKLSECGKIYFKNNAIKTSQKYFC